jgi:hypothetical protein
MGLTAACGLVLLAGSIPDQANVSPAAAHRQPDRESR